MLVITTVSILVLATAYHMWSNSEEQRGLKGPHGEMLRLGVQIICGDCCGDSDRPVKTYLDQLGRCGQCGGRAYVLASVYAHNKMLERRPEGGETTGDVRRQSFGPQVSLHAVGVHKISV